MATIGATFPTLLDIAKRMDPDGKIAKVVEYLDGKSPLIRNAAWKEGNLPTGNSTTSRTALPAPTWRRFNEGVAPTKSRTGQVVDACGMMSAYSIVDKAEAELNGNAMAWRMSEDMAFSAAFIKEAENGVFNHSTLTAPEKFHGLSPRFASTTAAGGSQIVGCEASPSGADQASMWLVGWSPETVFLTYPKGSKVGLQHEDRGVVDWEDSGGTNKFPAYVSYWEWRMGLVVRDYRFVSRIANIDVSSLDITTMTLINAAIGAYHKIEDPNAANLQWYCNRTVATFLHKQAVNNVKASTLTIENIAGKPVTTLLGVPVNVTDALTITESAVT